MNLDTLLALLIVAGALVFIARRITSSLRKGQCDCGCSRGKNCPSQARLLKK